MQFRVVVPANVKAGQIIRIRCPDGAEGEVKVPKGLRSGDAFVFEMPEAVSTKQSEGKGFLDREIVNLQDFLMALAVGLLIGLSIVAGFLIGVLTVTDPSIQGIKPTQMNAQATPRPQMRMPQGGEL